MICIQNLRKNPLLLSVLFILLTGGGIAAQQETQDSGNSYGTDSAFIADYKNLLTARVFLLYQDASFVLNPGNSKQIIFTPNVAGRIGIEGFYKWFGLGLSIGNPIFG